MDPETAAALNAHEYILEVLFSVIMKSMSTDAKNSILITLRNPSSISLPKGSGPVDMAVLEERRDAVKKRLDQFASKVESRL